MFDPKKEMQQLNEQSANIRKRSYKQRKSRLDKYKGELITLLEMGAKCTQLQRWLRKKRIKVSLSTVTRWRERNYG